MPTYEYRCQACNNDFETWQKMSDEPLTTCPKCGGRIRRVLFPAGIVFKGHGFYKTDHASHGAASENGHNAKSESGEAKTASESKASESSSKASEAKATASSEKK
jgi:putative FmdB family regulatory protein